MLKIMSWHRRSRTSNLLFLSCVLGILSTTAGLGQALWEPPSAADLLGVQREQISQKEKLLVDDVVTAWWHGPEGKLIPSLIALRAYYQQTGQTDRMRRVASAVFAPWRPLGHSGTVALAVGQRHLQLAKELLKQNVPDLAEIAFMSGADYFIEPERMLPANERPVERSPDWVKEKSGLLLCQTVREVKQIQPAYGPCWVNLDGTNINELLPLVGKNKQVKGVTVHAQHYGELDLSLLRRVPAIREVYLPQTLDDKSMLLLKGLANLRAIHIYSSKLTDEGMNVFCSLTGLQEVDLRESHIGDKGIAQLADLPALTDVYLYDLQVTGKGFERGFRNLVRLKIQACPLDDEGVAGISQLAAHSNLIQLSLTGTPVDDKSIASLSQLKTLKTLDLRRTKMSFEGLRKLEAALPNCRISPSPTHLAEYY
jgi:hypothetical protein